MTPDENIEAIIDEIHNETSPDGAHPVVTFAESAARLIAAARQECNAARVDVYTMLERAKRAENERAKRAEKMWDVCAQDCRDAYRCIAALEAEQRRASEGRMPRKD